MTARLDADVIREALYGETPLHVVVPISQATMDALVALDRLEARVHSLERENTELRDCYEADVTGPVKELRGRVHSLEQACAAASVLLEVIDGGPAKYDASEHSAACNDLDAALRAVVLEGAAGNALVEPKEKDMGGIASDASGTGKVSEDGWPPVYDFEKHAWTARCPVGTECSGCDALGYCTQMETSFGTPRDSGALQNPDPVRLRTLLVQDRTTE